MRKVTFEETTDNGTRFVTVARDGAPVIGLEITKDGAIIVGHWGDGETWKTLHTDTPEV